MIKNSIDNLEESLKTFIDKNVIIEQNGFLKSNFSIKKLEYSIECEILNIIDNENENYIKINLNQIYKIAYNEKSIVFYLDNDISITLEIKR